MNFRSLPTLRPSYGVLGFFVAVMSLIAAAQVAAAAEDGAAPSGGSDEQIRPLLVKYCQACHSGSQPKGGFHLDRLAVGMTDAAGRQVWQQVFEQLETGAMPPDGKPQPTEQESAAIQTWIGAEFQRIDAANRSADGRVVLRRLNRNEYENTINDLLGIQAKLKDQLPEDGAADGFDNAGAALHTSSFLMERYLEAADTALNLAISNRPQRPTLIQNRYSLKESHPVRTTMEKVYRFDGDTVVCLCSSDWHNVSVTKFYPAEGGFYRFRISASAFQSDGKPVTYRVATGGRALSGKNGLIGYFDAPPGEPKVVEFVRYMEPKSTISILPYGLPSAQAVTKSEADPYEGPGLAVQWVEAEGPLYDAWPPTSHSRLFGDLPRRPAPIYNFRDRVEVASDQPAVDAREVLRKFVRRAFRRQVTDDDVTPFVEVAEAKLAAGYTFEQAMRAALKGVLMAPEFLFLREVPGKLDDDALASRLSYFLWSTMPDDELLQLAERKELSRPEVLRAQVERMLEHPKAAAFTENFVGQWLNLREIDFTEPSRLLYPEYDHMLKVSMIRETELFFEELLRNDLSLANFIDSDFTLLNGRLARHYGVPGVDGWEFQKVSLPEGSHRGGVLTMAGVLKVTANGTTTSPVVRGAWVLDRILGTPPSPPPDDVPGLDPDIRGATTIREQLAKHRSVPACAGCHVKIDPPGFALESFDCIGGWRDNYRVTGPGEPVVVEGRRVSYRKGKPVDPSDVLPDGRPFANIDEFKRLLLTDKDRIARALTTKLVTYATGAAPAFADRTEVDRIVAEIRKKDYGLRSLVHELVQSRLFQYK